MLDDAEAALRDGPYLTGVNYGLADSALTPFVSRLNELGFEWMWHDLPHLDGWWSRIRQRNSFNTVFDAFPNPARRQAMLQAGKEVREQAVRILATK